MKKKINGNKVRRAISIDAALLEKLEDESIRKTGGNFSFLVCRIFEAYFNGKLKISY